MALSRWRLVGLLAVASLSAGWFFTRPAPLDDAALDGLTGDAVRGELIFAAAGCASCHTSKDGPADLLMGGKRFPSAFGTFVAPNISPDPVNGIGNWTDLELASAIVTGVSRDGNHLYPVFPYTTYNKANLQDVVDLIAHLRTLPPSDAPSEAHDVSFPFNQRAALGPWKALFVNDNWALTEASSAPVERGRYLTEALGHCAECHTPRNIIGGLIRDQWLAGAANPSGEGRIPNITAGALDWSEADIAEYLKSGFTPDFDTAGGEMVDVIKNTSQLTDDDRAAIAAYVKAVPAIANATP
jgi:mono/diheme cytochrome c family protein